MRFVPVEFVQSNPGPPLTILVNPESVAALSLIPQDGGSFHVGLSYGNEPSLVVSRHGTREEADEALHDLKCRLSGDY